MLSHDSRGRRTHHNQRGFTVLEAVVATALTVIVMGIAAPELAEVRTNYKLEGFTRQLVMEISKARMQAIAQNRTVRVRFPTTKSYVIETSEDGTNFQAVTDTISMPTGIWVLRTGTPKFNRQGMAADSATFWVFSPAGIQAFEMSLLGRIERYYL